MPLSDDPFKFVNEFKAIKEGFYSLKIDGETVLQYGIWNGMNDLLREQFVSIINVNKPSLKLIDKHKFDAIESLKDTKIV